MAKSINFMVKHKISWRNAGEILLRISPRNFETNHGEK